MGLGGLCERDGTHGMMTKVKYTLIALGSESRRVGHGSATWVGHPLTGIRERGRAG